MPDIEMQVLQLEYDLDPGSLKKRVRVQKQAKIDRKVEGMDPGGFKRAVRVQKQAKIDRKVEGMDPGSFKRAVRVQRMREAWTQEA